MKFFRQLLALLRMNLAGLTQRLGSSLTILVGVTSAVGVLVSMLAMGIGAREQQLATIRAGSCRAHHYGCDVGPRQYYPG